MLSAKRVSDCGDPPLHHHRSTCSRSCRPDLQSCFPAAASGLARPPYRPPPPSAGRPLSVPSCKHGGTSCFLFCCSFCVRPSWNWCFRPLRQALARCSATGGSLCRLRFPLFLIITVIIISTFHQRYRGRVESGASLPAAASCCLLVCHQPTKLGIFFSVFHNICC